MKKTLFLLLVLFLGFQTFAQNAIQLRSSDKAECVKSDYSSLKATFSFSSVETNQQKTEKGRFATLTMPNTVIGGSEGDPQLPVVNQLIAVPVGATPTIRVTHFTSTDYKLADYGIDRIMPRQPDLRKDQKPEDVPFVYNEAAYQVRGMRSEPKAMVSADGTLRGVRIGQLSIEPVSYDPVNNTIRVFNDIEVEVAFEGADAWATEQQLLRTYSPYFNSLYQQLFNGRAVLDVYDEHPDLYTTPVKMLVIANRMFEDCIQDWLAWKTNKGIYVDVNYTDNIGSTASAIKTFIQNKYASDAPTFLMIMGDKDQVPASATGSATSCVTDLSYSSVDGDEFVDMFHSRFPAETVAQMTAMLNKALEYEQYTMPDPSYLNNVLLIAGEDSSGWGVQVGRPTIWYATNYYYNAEHGFSNVYEFSHGTYTNCYSYLSSGVGFANYTAHGSNTSWAGPSFTVSDVNSLTNTHKYFLAMGNCCQAADWGISGTCFGEAMVRAENKGAYAYIGSCPSTYWLNDYYFGVGPTNRADGTMPTMDETGTGCYDAIWNDDAYNTVNSILYIGNLAGNAAQALGYELHISTLYYWQAYHVLGDGSIMPYRVQPTANQVSHMAIFPIGMSTYPVSAVPGSLVAISKDGVLYGTAQVGTTGTVNVPITPVTSSGNVTICVTAPNRIPYIATVPAAAMEGPYITVDSYTPTSAHVGDNTALTLTVKNVGADATSGTTTVTLSSTDPNVASATGTKTFGVLAPEATTTLNGFQFRIASGVADGTNVTLHYTAVNGSETWEGNLVVTAGEAVLEYQNMTWDGSFTPGETLTLTAKFKNTGHYQATNAVARMTTSSSYLSISNPTVNVGTIAVDQEVSCQFNVTIASNCPETAQLPVTFTMTADGNLSAQGTETLKNACNIVFNLVDSYGDGWNGNVLTVSFDDGSPSQELTINNGNSANYTIEVGNGVHVTLTWTTGSYASECSFSVSYDGDLLIYQSSGTPSAGVLYQFDCNCAAASQTFTVSVSSAGHGTVSGGGTDIPYGQSCTVTALPDNGYHFTGWTENGTMVSQEQEYTFAVNNNRNLVAHFEEGNQIGSGTTTNAYLPSYNYYKYTLSQQLYTALELGGAGTLTAIAFYNGGAEKTRTYDFYLKATTKSTFSSGSDWIAVTSSDKVFSGSVTMTANDWTWITFSTPFEYDGTSNLVLVADDNTGSYTNSPHMTCRVFDANNQAIYIYSDNTNYNPSSPSSYSGTRVNVKNQIQFSKENATPVTYYDITATASPATGGTISGTGSIQEGSSCTLIATPATGYHFVRWTKNGTQVSTNATYTFTVTESAAFVAEFALNNYAVNVSASPAAGGTVSGSGTYNHGDSCTLTATPATGYQFVRWTKNGTQVSTNATYTFTVTQAASYVAEFTLISYTVTATADPAEGGTITGAGTFNHGATCTLTANPADGYEFVAWMENGNTLGTEPSLSFTVESNRTLTARFNAVTQQTQTLAAGWGWVSFFINLSGEEGLHQLEEALGSNGSVIKSQTSMVQNIGSTWVGTLHSIDVEHMYKIKAANETSLTISAEGLLPEEHPITLTANYWNWIGYPSSVETDLAIAMSDYTATNNDMIKSQNRMATYIEGYGWWGTLDKLTPSQGYMYKSNASLDKTLVFATQGNKGLQAHTSNATNLHWNVDAAGFSNNANVIATLDASQLPLSEEMEIGAFVNGECRGTARMLYVEPYDQYIAFLTVFGEDSETLQFAVYHQGEIHQADEQLTFADNMVVGKANEPYILHVGNTERLILAPNPVNKGEAVLLELPSHFDAHTARVEVFNAFGSLIRTQAWNGTLAEISTSGVYTIRVTDGQGQTCYGKLIVK